MMKNVADWLVNKAKKYEMQFYPGAVILKGFTRLVQLDSFSCGVQAACMVLRYFKKGLPAEKVQQLLNTTNDGTSGRSIKQLFLKRGLKVQTFSRCYPKRLRQAIAAGSPVLLSFDAGEHWVVLFGYHSDRICFIADPSVRRAAMCAHSAERLRERWDGYAMIVSNKQR